MKTLKDFDFTGKKTLIRCDFNISFSSEAKEENEFRIKSSIPTIKFLIEKGAKIILMSHLEDPNGKTISILPVAEKLSKFLGVEVKTAPDCIGKEAEEKISELKAGGVLLLENLRMRKEEKGNNMEFAEKLAKLGDIYINDAFSVCHRKHASVVLIPKLLPAAAGLALEKEINILSNLLENPEKPFCAIIGGAKITSKSSMIKKLLEKADNVLLGGKVANAILQVKGIYQDSMTIEENLAEKIATLDITSPKIHIPFDAIVSKDIAGKSGTREAPVGKLQKGEMILDIGPETISVFSKIIKESRSIIWAGPMGLFEEKLFEKGTKEIAGAIINNSNAYKVVGGGDTISAISRFGLLEKFDHVSTGGGAMLAFMGGEKLPGIEVLG